MSVVDIVDFERLEPSVYPSENFVFEFFENYPAPFSSFATPCWVCHIFSTTELTTKLEIRNNNAIYCVCAVMTRLKYYIAVFPLLSHPAIVW